MVCHLFGTRPLSKPVLARLLLINELQWNSNKKTKLFIHKNASERIFCEILAAILSRGRWVNSVAFHGISSFFPSKHFSLFLVWLFNWVACSPWLMWHFSPQLGNWLSCVAFLSDRWTDVKCRSKTRQLDWPHILFALLALAFERMMETFPLLLALCEGKPPVTGRFPSQRPVSRQWEGALMYSLIYAWTNSWANNWEAGDLRCHHAHYDVAVMCMRFCLFSLMHWLPWLCFSTAFWNAFPWEKGFVWFNFWSSLFIMDQLTII